jgi:hypothetical protein
MKLRSLAVLSCALLFACSSGSDGGTTSDGAAGAAGAAGGAGAAASDSVTQMVGAEGGVIQVGGATVTFPAGAVPTATSITISALDDAPPDGFVALSKVFRCAPAGLDFSKPVTMAMPFTPDGGAATLFWSTGSDPAFKDIGGVPQGNTMTTTIQHFSSGFVGRAR